jgi:hypothetical protein
MSDDHKIYDEVVDMQKHPGRRHTQAELRKLKAVLRKLSRSGNEREFMQFLRGIGLKDESPGFAELVRLFRTLSGKP